MGRNFLEDKILETMNLAFVYDLESDVAKEWDYPLVVAELEERYVPHEG